MISDSDAQLYGKLTALEFVLEVMLANELSHQPEEAVAEFKRELTTKPGYIRRGPVDALELQAIQAAATAHLERFVEKVSERERGLRQQRDRH